MASSVTLLNTVPFDALKPHSLEFLATGAQVFNHEIIITSTITNEVVYKHKTASMSLFVAIPLGTLQNGLTYLCKISVFDKDGIQSPYSNSIVLKCLKTPSFNFLNIVEGEIVKNSFCDVILEYTQENDELLNEYRVMLYDSSKGVIIFDTGNLLAISELTAHIPELINNTTYHLRATGETVNGMEIDTGYISIIAIYKRPNMFLKFRADNNKEEGTVLLSSYFILKEGWSIPESLEYIDGTKVSLKNGERVIFDDGITASDIFYQDIREDMTPFTKIITWDIGLSKMEVTWNWGYFGDSEEKQYYAFLRMYTYVGDEQLAYIQYSNRISPPLTTDQI